MSADATASDAAKAAVEEGIARATGEATGKATGEATAGAIDSATGKIGEDVGGRAAQDAIGKIDEDISAENLKPDQAAENTIDDLENEIKRLKEENKGKDITKDQKLQNDAKIKKYNEAIKIRRANMTKDLKGSSTVSDLRKSIFEKIPGPGGLKYLAAAFIGYEFMIRKNMQTADECKKKCKERDNPMGTCKDPNIPDAICPKETPDEDCGKYCDVACSRENRLARAKQRVIDDPTGSALGVIDSAFDHLIDDPIQIWDTFKYIFIGIGVIILLFVVYKFSSSWVSGKAATLTMMGATSGSSGLNAADVQKYKRMKDNIKAINSY